MMQSAGKWYFKPDGKLDILDNAPLKAALHDLRQADAGGHRQDRLRLDRLHRRVHLG